MFSVAIRDTVDLNIPGKIMDIDRSGLNFRDFLRARNGSSPFRLGSLEITAHLT